MFNYFYFAKSCSVYPADLGGLLDSLWWLIYHNVKGREKTTSLLGALHLGAVCAAAVVCINLSYYFLGLCHLLSA